MSVEILYKKRFSQIKSLKAQIFYYTFPREAHDSHDFNNPLDSHHDGGFSSHTKVFVESDAIRVEGKAFVFHLHRRGFYME